MAAGRTTGPCGRPSESVEPQAEIEILVVAPEPWIEDRAGIHRRPAQGLQSEECGGSGYGEYGMESIVVGVESSAAIHLHRQTPPVERDTPAVHKGAFAIGDSALNRGEPGVVVERFAEHRQPVAGGQGVVVEHGDAIDLPVELGEGEIDRRRETEPGPRLENPHVNRPKRDGGAAGENHQNDARRGVQFSYGVET